MAGRSLGGAAVEAGELRHRALSITAAAVPEPEPEFAPFAQQAATADGKDEPREKVRRTAVLLSSHCGDSSLDLALASSLGDRVG